MSHRILVVEDDHQLRHIVVETLEDEDYIVKGAAHVAGAVALSEKMHFDLVVTDVRMPDTNGIEGFMLLKKRLPELKCVVMTGYADLPPKKLAVEVGVSEYIYKPFPLDELIAVVDRVVHSKKWALFYSNIIQKGPLRVLAGVFHALKKDRLSEVNEIRAQVFESLYLAISCDRYLAQGDEGDLSKSVIPKDTANGLYYQLDNWDRDYEKYLRSPSEEAALQLLETYRELFEKFTAFIRSGAGLAEPGRLNPAEFNSLYKAIQEGQITPQEFFFAPALRLAEPHSLKDSPKLLELQQKMWHA